MSDLPTQDDERTMQHRYSQALLMWDLKGTPSLEEYAAWLHYDSNLPYRLGPGHLENLVDEALERLGIE